MIDLKEGTIISIDKPLGWTSFQLLNKFRYLASQHIATKKLKVGHAGTLDPLATGVVVLCTGKKTKLIETLQNGEKEYIAEVYLGKSTPSFDLETEVDVEMPIDHITKDMILDTLLSFLGEQEQVPPIFSAVKINGRRAYKYARKGQEVELKSKKIYIKEIELLEYDLPKIKIRVLCGKGTYIRSLARDIALSLDTVGHLSYLRRTKVGEFDLSNTISVDDIQNFLDNNVEKVDKDNL